MKVYRINIIVQEYDAEGFWDVSNKIEMAKDKKQLLESIEKLYNDAKKFIEDRLI